MGDGSLWALKSLIKALAGAQKMLVKADKLQGGCLKQSIQNLIKCRAGALKSLMKALAGA